MIAIEKQADRPRELRRRFKRHLEELPVLPAVVGQMMSLDKQSDSYFEDVQAIIESDPTFAIRTLAAANSASAAGQARVSTINGAITRIGSQSVSNLILGAGVIKVFTPRDAWEKSLWRHALQVAHVAQALAVQLGDVKVAPAAAYAIGLLHDVGRFIMFAEAPEVLRQVDESDWNTGEELMALEREKFGIAHAEVGAVACEHWGMSKLVCSVIGNHHGEIGSLSDEVSIMTALIQLADYAMFSSVMPGCDRLSDASDEFIRENLKSHAATLPTIRWDAIPSVLREAAHRAEATCGALGLD